MLWLISLAMGSEVAFYPGRGDVQVKVESSTLTGRLLARSRDIEALRVHPDVASVRRLPGPRGVVSIEPRSGVSSVDLANALHGQTGVEWAHPDVLVPIVELTVPDDPLLGSQWHLINDGQRGFVPGVDINAEEAWSITAGAGIRIAVLDSGTDVDHPDLIVIDGQDYVDGDGSSDPEDDNNHGTAVAGLVAATGNNGRGVAGVAYEAEIYGIRVIAGGEALSSQVIYEAFVEAVDNGSHVINNSWGPDNRAACGQYPIVGAIEDAFEYVETEGRDGLGTVNVFASGNDGCDTSGYGVLEHPAILGVGAVDGFDRLTNYSNTGPWLDIVAPSNNIATLDLAGADGGNTNLAGDPDYTGNFGGTSAAAPLVAGTAALMIAANPRITAEEVRRVLCDTAVRVDIVRADYDTAGHSPRYGCGRIDAGAAVRMVANLGPPEAPEIPESAVTTLDDAVLRWAEAIDPDDDVLQYRVRWAFADRPDDEEVELVDGTFLDLSEVVGAEPVTVTWRVRAIDPWGAGDWSATQTLAVELPPEPRGCSHLPAPGVGLVGLAGLLGVFSRRRDRGAVRRRT